MQILGPAPDLLNQNQCCEKILGSSSTGKAGDALPWGSCSLTGIWDHSAGRAAEMTLTDV